MVWWAPRCNFMRTTFSGSLVAEGRSSTFISIFPVKCIMDNSKHNLSGVSKPLITWIVPKSLCWRDKRRVQNDSEGVVDMHCNTSDSTLTCSESGYIVSLDRSFHNQMQIHLGNRWVRYRFAYVASMVLGSSIGIPCDTINSFQS